MSLMPPSQRYVVSLRDSNIWWLFYCNVVYSTLRTVFSVRYIAMAVAITGVMLFGLLLLSEFIFLEPYVIGYIAPGAEASFALILGISIMSGLVLPMNIYRMTLFRTNKSKMGGGFVGSFIGAVAGACSCGPVGFAIISTFGSVGSAAASFLTNYEIFIRTAALGILFLTLYTTNRSLKTECRIA